MHAGLGDKRAWGGGGAGRSKQCAGEDLNAKSAGRACAERTLNKYRMVVTLDVSQLSGWLNADAPCRVERRACDAGRGAAREA